MTLFLARWTFLLIEWRNIALLLSAGDKVALAHSLRRWEVVRVGCSLAIVTIFFSTILTFTKVRSERWL